MRSRGRGYLVVEAESDGHVVNNEVVLIVESHSLLQQTDLLLVLVRAGVFLRSAHRLTRLRFQERNLKNCAF